MTLLACRGMLSPVEGFGAMLFEGKRRPGEDNTMPGIANLTPLAGERTMEVGKTAGSLRKAVIGSPDFIMTDGFSDPLMRSPVEPMPIQDPERYGKCLSFVGGERKGDIEGHPVPDEI